MTSAQLRHLEIELEEFVEWRFDGDNSSSEGSDARSCLNSVRSAIRYTPEQIERDRKEGR